MNIKIGEKAPEFKAKAFHNNEVKSISSSDYRGKWLVLFFYPADFTFVCPTELADLNRLYPEFRKLKAEVMAVSTDTVYTHKAWLEVEKLLTGVKYPMASDHNGKFSQELGIYDEEISASSGAD